MSNTTLLRQLDPTQFTDSKVISSITELSNEINAINNLFNQSDNHITTFMNSYSKALLSHQVPFLSQLSKCQNELPFDPSEFNLDESLMVSLINEIKNCQNRMKPLCSESNQALSRFDQKCEYLRKGIDVYDQQVGQHKTQIQDLEKQISLITQQKQKKDEDYKSKPKYQFLEQKLFQSQQKQSSLELQLKLSQIQSDSLTTKLSCVQSQIDKLKANQTILQKQIKESQQKIEEETRALEFKLAEKKIVISPESNDVPYCIYDSYFNIKNTGYSILEQYLNILNIPKQNTEEFSQEESSFLSTSIKISSLQNKLLLKLKQYSNSGKLNCLLLINSPQKSSKSFLTFNTQLQELIQFCQKQKERLTLTIYDVSPQKVITNLQPCNISYLNMQMDTKALAQEFCREKLRLANSLQQQQDEISQIQLRKSTVQKLQDDITNQRKTNESIEKEMTILKDIEVVGKEISCQQTDLNNFVQNYREEEHKKCEKEEQQARDQISDHKSKITRITKEEENLKTLLPQLTSFREQSLERITKLVDFVKDLYDEMDLLFSFIWAYFGKSSIQMLYFSTQKTSDLFKLEKEEYYNIARLLSLQAEPAKKLLNNISITYSKTSNQFNFDIQITTHETELQVGKLRQLINRESTELASHIKDYKTIKDLKEAIENHNKNLQ